METQLFNSPLTFYIVVAVFGLIIGSFLNVVIMRLDGIKSIVALPSHCPHCQRKLSWFELIPVFSYIILVGKCRTCKQKISLQYPIVEIMTAIIFSLMYWQFGLSVTSGVLMLISAILIVVFVYDLIHSMIADWLVWLGLSVWAIYLILDLAVGWHFPPLLYFSALGGGILGGFIWLLVWISKETWMGAGDIKLGFLLGAIAGWPNALMLTLIAFIMGGAIGLILIALRRKGMKDQVPFAPFLITALWITLFWGTVISNWYIGSLF